MTLLTTTPHASTALDSVLDIVDTALATLSRRLPEGVSREDLASVGKVALITALSQCFGTVEEVRAYCFVRVRGAMLDELRRLDPLSRRHRALAAVVGRTLASLEASLGRTPTDYELAAAAQVTEGDVAAIRAAASRATADFEWERIPDREAVTPAESVEIADLHACLHAALERLPANQAFALRRYYLEDGSLDDVAAELGVSRERARQVRDAAENKLRGDLLVLSLWHAFVQHRT